jgi:carbon storage regulator
MLVLSRQKGERIRIGNDIEIQVIRCQSSRTMIGITAPDDINIIRTELLEDAGFLPLFPSVHNNGDEPLQH